MFKFLLQRNICDKTSCRSIFYMIFDGYTEGFGFLFLAQRDVEYI